jgi:hypothetical protein
MHAMRRLLPAALLVALALPATADAANGKTSMVCAERAPSANGDRYKPFHTVTKPQTCSTYASNAQWARNTRNGLDIYRIKWESWGGPRATGYARERFIQGEFSEKTGKMNWDIGSVGLTAYRRVRVGKRLVYTRLRVESGTVRRVIKLRTR